MKETKWGAVAALFGVQLGEEFDIKEAYYNPYMFNERGLVDCDEEVRDEMVLDLLNGEKEIVKRPFKPKKGECYWYVTNCKEIRESMNCFDISDYGRMAVGNCYQTHEEAIAHLRELVVQCEEFFRD